MPLYNKHDKTLTNLKETPFHPEKEIQALFEANLEEITSLELVRSGFVIKNKRIDTLAFDIENKSFVIIEYKHDKSFSVIDQGFAYLGLMLENKAELVVEYNEKLKKQLKRGDVDWSQSKVMFVSSGFSDNQLQAANFKDIAIGLWEVKGYEGDLVLINEIKKTLSAESIKPITQKSEKLKAVAEEIRIYTEEQHLSNKSEYIKELYHTFKNAIINLSDGIEVNPKKQLIDFTRNGKRFSDLVIQAISIVIYINLNKGELDDPKGIAKDVSNLGKWGSGDYRIQVTDTANLEYIMSLVKQGIR